MPFALHSPSNSSGKKSRFKTDIESVIHPSRPASYRQKCWCESMVTAGGPSFISGSAAIKIVLFRQVSQSRSGALRSDVALRAREHFVPHHEFLHRGRSQQRRKIMCVEMKFRMTLAIRGRLMEPHRIGESRFEQIVVANGQPSKDVGEISRLRVVQSGQAGQMATAQDHRFEWPDRPVRYQRQKSFVLAHNSLSILDFQA